MSFKLYLKIKNHLLISMKRTEKTGFSLLINSLPDTIKTDLLFKIYSKIIKELFSLKKIINATFTLNPIDLLKENDFNKDALEAYVVKQYLLAINSLKAVSDRQKFLYFLTSYFNEKKDWINADVTFIINESIVSFDDLYNKYIDVLVANPELKVVNYSRDEFENFTQEEIEE